MPEQSVSNDASPSFVVVIGASAGGLTAVSELVSQLKPGMDAAVFIVMHLSRKGIGDFLVHRLQQHTSLPCKVAGHGDAIQRDHIYLAPPNQHLVIKQHKMLLGRGPEENRWRPSIDVLFRSAAVAYSSHVIGVIITGMLDDGTAGMVSIKNCGGICIVQDPNEAEYPEMPLSVLNRVDADYCLSLADMGYTLQELTKNGSIKTHQIPEDLRREAEISEKVATGIDKVAPLGEQSVYACPDCGGTLWNIAHDHVNRYRCHIGHSYSENDLVIKQAHHLEATLWVALRMMEDRRNLLNKLGRDSLKRGSKILATAHGEKEKDLETHIEKLKEILFLTQNNNP